jgi:hypothetical protein
MVWLRVVLCCGADAASLWQVQVSMAGLVWDCSSDAVGNLRGPFCPQPDRAVAIAVVLAISSAATMSRLSMGGSERGLRCVSGGTMVLVWRDAAGWWRC